jgi:hypothetical protein
LAQLQVSLPAEARAAFSLSITEEELKVAVWNGKRNKAPGLDGIPTDFFLLAWDTVKTDILSLVNEMYHSDSLPALQKRGVVVCVPKIPRRTRFLTLLNADHKLFARILAARLKPWLSSLLHPSQYGGVGNTNILDALATIRDTIAEAEFSHHPVCLLSIDYKEAFDRVAHPYLFQVLETYSFGPHMTTVIRNLTLRRHPLVKSMALSPSQCP